MSRIGDYNLRIQRQANELGFSTVQEALDDDYSIVDGQLTYDAAKGLESAHRAWEKEKEYTIAGLKNAKDFIETLCEKSGLASAWRHDYERQARRIDRAIKFIEEAHE